MRQRTLAAMAVIACTVALGGCNADDTPPTASSTSPGHSSASGTATTNSTPTPTRSLTPDEQELRSAEEAITEYWRVVDDAASNPNQNLNVLATVARSQALAQWQTTLTDYRTKSWVQHGSSTVESAVATTKDGKDFTVVACRDVTSVDVTDSSGKSVVRPDRPVRQQFTYTVSRAPEGYFVTQDLLKGAPCVE